MLPQLNEIDLEFNNVFQQGELSVDDKVTAIVKHIPTGLTADCDYERSWMYNRNIALGMLTQKVHDYYGTKRYE
jgi:protein subunit release factor A